MSLFKYILLFVQFLFILDLHAQNADSLKKELSKVHSDRERSKLFSSLSDATLEKDPDSSFVYASRSLTLAKIGHIDSMVMQAHKRLACAADHLNKFEEAFQHLDTAIMMARAVKDDYCLLDFIMTKAVIENEAGSHRGAIKLEEEMLPLAIRLKSKNSEAKLYQMLSESYTHLDKYDIAMNYSSLSTKMYDALQNNKELAHNYSSIFSIYGKQKKYKEALKYVHKADSMYALLNDETNHNQTLIDEAIIYKNLGEYDKAIDLYKKALVIFNTDSFVQMFVYSNMGIAFGAKGNYGEAQKCYTLSQAINQRSFHMPEIEFANDKEQALVYFKQHDLDSALHYARLAETAGSHKNYRADEYKECLHLLADIYEAKGDLKNTRLYDLKYETLQDTALMQMETGNVADAETRFNMDEKNRQLSLLEKENELQKIKSQRMVIVLLFTALLVTMIVVAYRRTLRKNKQLSEQKQIIDHQLTQLEAAATMKTRFLANISHELRTPVTLLTGMLELIKDKARNYPPAQQDKLVIAYNNSRKLQYMIEEILDLSRVESKVAEVKSKTTETAPMLRRMVYAFETFIQKEQLDLIYDDTAIEGVYINIDENKLEKIINNLVYNAIKFNRKGGTIKVKAYLTADTQHQAIEISDTGVGINADDLPHIFERFYQGDTTNKAKSEGVGIGLSLVREFTLLLNGTISVISVQGEGTAFTLQFPVTGKVIQEEDHNEVPEPVPAEIWQQLGKLPKVLIVEDNTEMRYYLREVLGDKVDLAEAGNGKEALNWLEKNMADIIISDIMMPEMDGREFIAHLKSADPYKKIPIITLSALADIDNQLDLLRMGIDDYIVKPFNADELRIRVYNLLRNSQERKRFNEEPAEADDIKPESAEAEQLRAKITEYVSARLKNQDLSVNELALELNISERQFYRLAKGLTGCTPAQLVKEVRLQKAYELLMERKVNKIDDLARRVGFEDASYFSRQFMERFGKRPSEFL